MVTRTPRELRLICDEEDLRYWLGGTAEVLPVMSGPSQEIAYWVPIKAYFKAHPSNHAVRRISVIKEKSRFDKTGADALLRIATPIDLGAYLSPRPKTEKLYSNLLWVSHYAPDLHVAQTDLREPKQLWARARERDIQVTSEWSLRDGNLYSFHYLSRYPWTEFCYAGTHEPFHTSEWAESEDRERLKLFVRLLNSALQERLSSRPNSSRASSCWNTTTPSFSRCISGQIS